jgi:acetyl esterase/lipase
LSSLPSIRKLDQGIASIIMGISRVTPANFTDHVFKTVNGVELELRVWPADPAPSGRAPWVIWTHGGGYTAGRHFTPLSWLNPGMRARGFHMVASSYRLGPQGRLDDQLADSIDAVTWCRTKLPELLGPDKIDIDRLVVCGDSAGGTLATLLGHYLTPPPKVVIDAYGPVDFKPFGWLGWPQAADPPSSLPVWQGEFTDAELEAYLYDREPSNALSYSPSKILQSSDVELLSQQWGIELHNTKPMRLQTEFHVWQMRRNLASDFQKAVLHLEKFPDANALASFVKSLSAYDLLDNKANYPPTAFLHAIGDTEVPVSQSREMAKKLRQMGVPVVECYEESPDHQFDLKYTVMSAILSSWLSNTY